MTETTKTKRLISMILLLLALLCAAGAGLVCLKGPERETAVKDLPDPAETVGAFLDAVCTENYASAYDHLSGYVTLGLENTPEDADAARLWRLVRENTAWQADGSCTVSGLTAEQKVTLTFPDVAALTADLGDEVNAALALAVENAVLAEDVYNEDGSYREELVLSAYADAFSARFETDDLPVTSRSVTLHLEYADPDWLIAADSSLLSALAGGVG